MKQASATLAILLLLVGCKSNKPYMASGTFEATEVIVSAEGNGRLLDFNIWEGDSVSTDRQIGTIDTIQLFLKRMQLVQTGRSTDNRKQDVPKQIAAIKQQIATQERELSRFQQLYKNNAATRKQVEDIEAQIEVLRKQLAAQQSTLTLNNKALTEDMGSIDIQIAQLDDQLQKCKIHSPITGTILAKYMQEGELATVGKPLFKVADLNNIFLRAYITADQVTQLTIGQQVKIRADWDESGERLYDGIVTWIAGKSEFTPKTVLTRNERANSVYAVKIAVKNDGYLKIGMYGEVVE